MLVAGIDIGSITTEALLFDKEKGIVGYTIMQTGADSKKTAEMALEKVLAYPGKNVSDISYTISTGCGRKRAAFAKEAITEITCIANSGWEPSTPGSSSAPALKSSPRLRCGHWFLFRACWPSRHFLPIFSPFFGSPLAWN